MTEAVLPERSRGYKSKAAATVLTFFGGFLGFHRFYLGQWWGIFYLLLFWTGIPGLIAVIEFILFLVTSTEKWDEKHNEGIPRAEGESSGALVWVLAVIALGGIFILGILAAIAIPAYQDYTQRAQIGEAFFVISEQQTAIAEFAQTNNAYPDDAAIEALSLNMPAGAGLYVDSIIVTPDTGVITVTMQGPDIVGSRVAGRALQFTPPRLDQPFEAFTWECVSNAEPMYLPRSCQSTVSPTY